MKHVSEESDSPDEGLPSKTQRKQAMHELQALGQKLAELDPARLAALDLPERLRDEIAEWQRIRGHEARRRQMQFIGRLMREVDAEPLRRQIELWEIGAYQDTRELHDLESEREELLAEAEALDRLCAQHPGLDRAHWRVLIQKARDERARNLPPKHYRRIFQELKQLRETKETKA
jgi:ribosome-associated protein